MKIAAILLLACALVCGGILLYGYANSTLNVTALPVEVTPASQLGEEFARWRTALDHNAVQGTVFSPSAPGGAEDYVFMAFSVQVENRGLLPAEMVELSVAPQPGDVLSFTQAAAQGQDVNWSVDIPSFGHQTLRTILITRQDMHAVRELYVTYYIWGKLHTVKVTYG